MKSLSLYCLVVPKIKMLSSFSIRASDLSISENLDLADSLFFRPEHINAVVGGEFFLQLLETDKIKLGDELPTLQNTKFGWIIAGPVPQQIMEGRTINRQHLTNHICLSTQLSSVDETLKRFWELEEYTENTRLSGEEQNCEMHFVNTVNRDASGRFIVRLPFRENKAQVKRKAIKRLTYLERKFLKDSSLRQQYTKFIQEYIDLGHMSKITEGVGVLNSVYLSSLCNSRVKYNNQTTCSIRCISKNGVWCFTQ